MITVRNMLIPLGGHTLKRPFQSRGYSSCWLAASSAARKAREIDPEFPIVYMSGVSAVEWSSKGVPNSIMLEKPFAPAQLVTAVANLLNSGTPTAPT
jgi:hypothetical protein